MVGSIVWEVIGFFADKYEEHGMAELCFGLDLSIRQARWKKEARFRTLIEEARRQGLQSEIYKHATLAAHHILYPTLSPEELHARRETYGNVKWTETSLLAALAESPLVEVGAGRGQWQKALSDQGADILAFDDMSSPNTRLNAIGRVQKGSEDAVLGHHNRSLLLVYPNPGPMAHQCLNNYQGNTLVYVGEGRGGVNADENFFDLLAGGEWTLVKTEAVDTLPDCYERLYILRRSQPKAN